jgi:hypothetical protein
MKYPIKLDQSLTGCWGMDETYWNPEDLDPMKQVIINMNSLLWSGYDINQICDTYLTVLQVKFGDAWELK